MNELVPDFQVDEDYPIPSSSAFSRPNKSPMAEDEIMELLWQNGQVVMQSQTHKPLKKSEEPPLGQEQPPPSVSVSAQQLFMQEDEMASWLHYPLEDSSFEYSDLFNLSPTCAPVSAAPPPPPASSFCLPVPPARPGGEEPSLRVQNFAHFSRANTGREPTVVDSSATPMGVSGRNIGQVVEQVGTSSAAGGGGRETATSSPNGSGASVCVSAERLQFAATAVEDRKRKGVEADGDDAECQSDDIEFESPDAKKQSRGSTSTKRSRAAEVHNLSERRRRDRINEKMKALQELIPRCNKSDKASMLDEAIEYLKSLQMQVQMMSMGCGMYPMMFPGVQQYMPPIGMGMGMEIGMNRPMMPFLPMVSGSALPNTAVTAHMGPRFPMPAYHMQQSVPLPNPSGIQATNQSDPVISSRTQNPNQPHMPFFSDPYQQYSRLQHVPLPQNQVMKQPITSKPSSSREVGNPEYPKSG